MNGIVALLSDTSRSSNHREKSSIRLHTLIHKPEFYAGALSALLYLFLALGNLPSELMQVLVVSALCTALAGAVWFFYWRSGPQPGLWAVLFWALIFRLIAVVFGEPLLEDDHYRYLWDGYQLANGINPYEMAPEKFFTHEGLPAQYEQILDQINNPHLATIYGPLCQYVFALAYLFAPGEVWPLQLIFVSFDCMVVLLLSRMVTPAQLLLYAWSPLIIKEFAFTAHTDVMAVGLLLLAWYVSQSVRQSRLLDSAIPILLALAVATKVFAILLVPFLLRLRLKSWVAFLFTLTLLYAPFVAQSGFQVSEGLGAMGSVWLFNAPLYLLYLSIAGPDGLLSLQLMLFAFFAAFYLWLLWQHIIVKGGALSSIRADRLYTGFLLVLPALNAWYWVWVLPFAVLRSGLWAFLASFCLLFSYVTGLHLGDSKLEAYQQPDWVLYAQFLPIVAALIIEGLQKHKGLGGASTVER